MGASWWIGLALAVQGAGSVAGQGVESGVVFEEVEGVVAVEAEHYHGQDSASSRRWCLSADGVEPGVEPDGDPMHVEGASGGAYLEALPDTRRTHGDRLMPGVNFFPNPSVKAEGVLSYRVWFNTPGRYRVWARLYSTGTEDNGLHVGLDGRWPESGKRLQWCEGKHGWRWESRQRTQEEHCGVPGRIYLDIDEPGEHVIAFAMREDGAELDKWMMTTDFDARPEGTGPAERRLGEAVESE